MKATPQTGSVDVVIPARNAEATVAIAVHSARAQSLAPRRVLLMDGHSTDRSAEIARRAGAEVHRVEGGGVSRARNQGVALSQAEWIAFLDADDAWEPSWLHSALQCLKRSPDAALIYGQARQITEDGAEHRHPLLDLPSGDIYVELLTRSIVTTSACLVRRRCFVELGGFNERYTQGEDFDLWLRLATRGTCAAVPGRHVRYLRRADSAIHNPAFFVKSREQALMIVRAAFARRPVPAEVERRSLSHMYLLSAQRYATHHHIDAARRDLRQALNLWPGNAQAWQLALLTACSPARRQQILTLRGWFWQLRQSWRGPLGPRPRGSR